MSFSELHNAQRTQNTARYAEERKNGTTGIAHENGRKKALRDGIFRHRELCFQRNIGYAY